MRLHLAALAAFLLGIAGTVTAYVLLGDSAPTIKSAAAQFAGLKADETTSSDYVFVAPGLVYSFDAFASEYVIRKPPQNDLELIFGGAVDLPRTLHAVQKAARDKGVTVKRVICKTYYDAPKVKGVEDQGKMTEYVTRCRFVRTSVEAAFHRLTQYAEGEYKATAKRIRLERAEVRRARAAERRGE